MVAKSPPDGYTIMMGHVSVNAIAPSLFGEPAVRRDQGLRSGGVAASVPHFVVVHPSVAVTSLKELIAYLKTQGTS